jgi:parvulin-like peptidyl-prolyl isomerase
MELTRLMARSMKTKKSFAVLALIYIAFPAFAHASELAKVNGVSISDKDLKTALAGLNESQRQNLLKDADSRRQVLNSLIEQEVLVAEAAKEKLDQDQEFKDAMAAFRRNFLANRVIQKNLGAKVTEAAAKKYYETNKRRYSTDQVHAMHILVSDETQAREIMKQAKAPNADFQALAEKFSKDPSAKNNRGDLGFFGRNVMVAEFTDAAFETPTGEMVGPVKTAYGFHIIKVLEKKPGKAMTYEEVELRVKGDLRQELQSKYLSALKKQAKIQINDKAIDSL